MRLQRSWNQLRNVLGGRTAGRRCLSPGVGSRVIECLERRSLLAATFDPSDPFIINGTPTALYPSVGIVGDAGGGYGSGTLIGSRFVLTAAHCAVGLGPTDGRFTLGNTTYATSRVFVHPNYSRALLGTDRANDIAIFELNRPVVGVTPIAILRTAPTVGQLLTLVGFGGGGSGTSGTTGDFGTKRVGTVRIDEVSPTLISWFFDIASESNTAPGDSGGPALVTVGGRNFVAGVTSGGTIRDAGFGDHSFDTRVDPYAAWIDQILRIAPVTVSIDDHINTANRLATTLTLNGLGAAVGSGLLEVAGDRDVFQVVVPRTGTLVVTQTAAQLGTGGLDTVLRIIDGRGQQVAQNDDAPNGSSTNSAIAIDVTAGTYFLSAGSYLEQGTGEYSLTVAFTAEGTAGVQQEFFLSTADVGTFISSNRSVLRPDDSDIVRLTIDPLGLIKYELYFDGSDVGLTTDAEDIDAFSILPDGRILISTVGAARVLDAERRLVTANGCDVLVFTPIQVGSLTTGSWGIYQLGSTLGLSGAAGNVDSISVVNERLILSVAGTVAVGPRRYSGEDLIEVLPNNSLRFYFDGSDVGLSGAAENIDAAAVGSDGVVRFSTTGSFLVQGGVVGGLSDVVAFSPTATGAATAGAFDRTLALNGTAYGYRNFNLDGFQFGADVPDSLLPSSNFQIEVVFTDSSLTGTQQAIFAEAAAKWSSIIIGDVPDEVVNGVLIDDLQVNASAPDIDGVGSILGQAGPDTLRIGSLLPSTGSMEFDRADVAQLEADGQLLAVILHEMGHVLGIGTIWDSLGLVQPFGRELRFIGPTAAAEYNTIFGTRGNFVPVETDGGPGTAGAHWDEEILINELMTGFINDGTENPISRITIGSLQDIGYEVNLAAGDPYAPRSRSNKATRYIWDGQEHGLSRESEPVASLGLAPSFELGGWGRTPRAPSDAEDDADAGGSRCSTPAIFDFGCVEVVVCDEPELLAPESVIRAKRSPARYADVTTLDSAMSDLGEWIDRV